MQVEVSLFLSESLQTLPHVVVKCPRRPMLKKIVRELNVRFGMCFQSGLAGTEHHLHSGLSHRNQIVILLRIVFDLANRRGRFLQIIVVGTHSPSYG